MYIVWCVKLSSSAYAVKKKSMQHKKRKKQNEQNIWFLMVSPPLPSVRQISLDGSGEKTGQRCLLHTQTHAADKVAASFRMNTQTGRALFIPLSLSPSLSLLLLGLWREVMLQRTWFNRLLVVNTIRRCPCCVDVNTSSNGDPHPCAKTTSTVSQMVALRQHKHISI